ncbi:ATP-NAD kinase [Massarina eburnea CBS 473.64]|uniref:ATP-NAD kinase n=1 Tax=Massarina eburnea CBS 473.64 TaxID=1395130 RepID=A0A6A6RR14_9PLEO|nr:ATP-NAD kinase [Massarina eburnea CBS 473.64]
MKPTHLSPSWRPSPRIRTRCPSRAFSSTPHRLIIKDIADLPARTKPTYAQSPQATLLSLQWPTPPRNILITKKKRTPGITSSLIEYTTHLSSTYPAINIIVEPESAAEIHDAVPFPVYTYEPSAENGMRTLLSDKTDLICTLGGDGTILRASSLFSHSATVPPILSFAMGTLGFLGEWKFGEYKRAFREVYMSGASDAYANLSLPDGRSEQPNSSDPLDQPLSYADIRGKSMGSSRTSRILLRNRIKVGVFGPDGTRINSPADRDTYALNEVIVHRGMSPHLKIVDVFVGGRFLTEGVADGMIISSPTGSTAYSLSSGGSIVHPLVPSLLLTPICPRSLSFRPLVLPANTPITLRLGEKNRGREVDVSIDGKRMPGGMGVGMQVRVLGEEVRTADGEWVGGVPSIVRGTTGMPGGESEEDHWVGGLNALLKFNYPFGDQDSEGRR